MTIAVIHWSGTGNTERMAELAAKAIKASGKEVEEYTFASAPANIIEKADILVLGAPAMGEEEIDDPDILSFLNDAEKKISGKKLALFGSYGWGDGEWMRLWEERMTKTGANIITESLIVLGSPEGDDENKCIEFGKAVANG
ncbi:MAG: flavodoxin [Alphaproteobacteria bacterium]